MKASVIVWDLETVPDLGGFAAANDLVGKSDVEVREAIGGKFPKHIYHSIVCIGALIAHREPDHWAVDAVGAPHVGDRTEKELITAFCDKIAELRPQLITFNGSSFDLPVLRYRAMVHGVSAPGLSVRPYFNRYSEDAIDLCDALSSFSPNAKATLREISRIMGLPGKPKGFDGGEVERYFHEGKIKEIADYCESDIANTYRLWLRYELFRGALGQNAFEASERNLADFVSAKQRYSTDGPTHGITTMWKYGRFESFPCVYDDETAFVGFVLFVEEDGWREMPYSEVFNKVGVMSKSAFDARFPNLPPIPSAARHSGE